LLTVLHNNTAAFTTDFSIACIFLSQVWEYGDISSQIN
jgi:hypothetical protein